MGLLSSLLFCTLADAHADPAAPPANTSGGKHELTLRSASAQNVIELMHWSKPGNFPDGVTNISAAPSGKSLIVVGTDAGFDGVKEIVGMVDVPVRSVQLRVQFVSAKTWDVTSAGVPFLMLGEPPANQSAVAASADTRIQQASGEAVGKMLTTLTKSTPPLSESTITASNNSEASATLTAAPGLPSLAGCAVYITPRINDDNTVTLFLHPAVTTHSVSTQKDEVQETKLVGKTASGQPFLIGNLVRSGSRPSDQELLIFITPTVLDGKS